MSLRPYKVRIPFRWSEHDLSMGSGEMVEIAQWAKGWLAHADREHHFVNAYFNVDEENRYGEAVVVITDRDTALMLRLASS